MRIAHLYYLKVTAECGSISLAAEKLFLSQQTLSDIIAKAEKTLNITIFSRSNKGVILTEDGSLAMEMAQIILSIYGDMMTINGPQEPPVTQLKVMTHQSITACFFTEIQAMLTLALPNVQLQIREEMSPVTTITQVANGNVDIGLTAISTEILKTEPTFNKYLNKLYYVKILCVDQLYAVVRSDSPLAQKSWLMIEELYNFPMVLNRNSYLAEGLKHWFPEKDLDVFMYSDSAVAQICAIKENHGIGFTEGYALGQTFILEDGLAIIPLKDCSISVAAFLGPKIANNPAVTFFISQFQRFLSETLDVPKA